MSYIPTSRAFTLLLAFVLGGIATPLVHQAGHLLIEEDALEREQGMLAVESTPAQSHECVLCDMRLHAPAYDSSGHAEDVTRSTSVVLASGVMPHTPLRSFDGRAPPALS